MRRKVATHTWRRGESFAWTRTGEECSVTKGLSPSKPSLSPSFMSKLLKLEWVPHLRDDDPAPASLSLHRRTITSVIRRTIANTRPSRNFRLASSALKSTTESSPSWFSNAQTSRRRESPTKPGGRVDDPVNNRLPLGEAGRSFKARLIVVDSGSHLLRCAISSIVREMKKMWTQSLSLWC
jgi:hypothetical protein